MSLGTYKRLKALFAICIAFALSFIVRDEFFVQDTPTIRYMSPRDYIALRLPAWQKGVGDSAIHLWGALYPSPTPVPTIYIPPAPAISPFVARPNLSIPRAVTLKKGAIPKTSGDDSLLQDFDARYRVTEVTTSNGFVEVVAPVNTSVPIEDLHVLGRLHDTLQERGR
jgi:hypothetical protein